MLQAGEEHDDQCKRATDRIWFEEACRLSEVTSNPDNQVKYHLKDGPESLYEGRADTHSQRHQIMSRSGDASKNEQGSAWIDPKVTRRPTEVIYCIEADNHEIGGSDNDHYPG